MGLRIGIGLRVGVRARLGLGVEWGCRALGLSLNLCTATASSCGGEGSEVRVVR